MAGTASLSAILWKYVLRDSVTCWQRRSATIRILHLVSLVQVDKSCMARHNFLQVLGVHRWLQMNHWRALLDTKQVSCTLQSRLFPPGSDEACSAAGAGFVNKRHEESHQSKMLCPTAQRDSPSLCSTIKPTTLRTAPCVQTCTVAPGP